MARSRSPVNLDELPDGGTPEAAAGTPTLIFDAYLAGNNTSRQALGAGGQDGEAWLCLEVSRADAAMLLQHFHLLTGRSFRVSIDVEPDA
jgi:hypothetical protein